eukprot:CAMPEP_0177212330 /NCGR_PEP_ID=MMETSP0367-20130122/32578_1 /TAXON_ID=447022 ORGANISM="Scrippsiella hangoei-like, Strain SHHI-4" /NCGR_SAMPLE_ID=MMETSP0367 /ASSEMBLY_ACC=CAM_ASM_000362 /LENGTH=67 /DNA_ID=CAMNT_0018661595 /DNA_START=57 /DNA_END=257 /DNA_ORIENTATION=+
MSQSHLTVLNAISEEPDEAPRPGYFNRDAQELRSATGHAMQRPFGLLQAVPPSLPRAAGAAATSPAG